MRPLRRLVPSLLLALLTAAAAPARAAEPVAFVAEARLLARIVACTDTEAPLPAGVDPKVVASHCREMKRAMTKYKDRWLATARPFIAGLVPAGLPATVVYPFGGADLNNALAVYPDAAEITTLSLEYSGDPRTITTLRGGALATSLRLTAQFVGKLIAVNHNRTLDLERLVMDAVPAPLVFALVGLGLHDRELVSVHAFTLADDGAVRYLTADDLAAIDRDLALAPTPAKRRAASNAAFPHVEVRFRKRATASAPAGPVQVFRHLRANLANDHFGPDTAVGRHLAAKGRVAAMTKAASYLLWRGAFTNVRSWLLANMIWMISDSTGPPPSAATAAGFVQDVWGHFNGAAFAAPSDGGGELVRYFATQPARKLPFFFGYPDRANRAHLVVTRRP